jgi:uncharacterized protein (DUF2235 family)
VFNGPHLFHDTALSRSVQSARHAVAVDERRRTFEPTLWDNVAALNAGVSGEDRPYRQEWFPGTHGSVGGGGDITGLSNAAAVWIAEGAMAAGFAFERERIEGLRAGIDPLAPLRNQREPPATMESLMSFTARDREGPDDAGDVAEVTKARWRADPGYRPKTLAKVAAALDAGV